MHTGTTVLLTTRYLEEADQFADRVAVINHGWLISAGTPEELKARTGGSVLELSIDDSQREPAMQALRGVNGGHATYDHHRGKVIVPASRGVDTLREALHRLDTAGIRPGNIGLYKPTLDGIFLHITSQTKELALP